MKNNPKVSVGIVTYNHEQYIRDLVLSIVEQDYQNVEIVVSDDASTDRTGDILMELKALHPDLLTVILQDKNVGLVENCNVVLAACSGDYICLTGGDDVYLPGKLRKQIDFMEAHPEFLLSYHQVEAFDTKTNRHLYYFTEKAIEGRAEELIENGMEFLPLGAMFRRSAHMPRFREGIPIASDWIFCVELLSQNGGRFGFMPGIYARYRRHDSNITNTSDHQDNWRALEYLSLRYPELRSSIERFRSRLTIIEYRTGRLTLWDLLRRGVTSPTSFIWAARWLADVWFQRRKINIPHLPRGRV